MISNEQLVVNAIRALNAGSLVCIQTGVQYPTYYRNNGYVCAIGASLPDNVLDKMGVNVVTVEMLDWRVYDISFEDMQFASIFQFVHDYLGIRLSRHEANTEDLGFHAAIPEELVFRAMCMDRTPENARLILNTILGNLRRG